LLDNDDLIGVVVTFSDRHTRLTGRLQLPSGRAAPDFVVIVFPEDPIFRNSARRLRRARPASDGSFVFADLPPGEYLVGALTDLPEDWHAPDVLAQVARGAASVTIGEGEKKVQDLRIAGGTLP
jgi:hypothetical protein